MSMLPARRLAPNMVHGIQADRLNGFGYCTDTVYRLHDALALASLHIPTFGVGWY